MSFIDDVRNKALEMLGGIKQTSNTLQQMQNNPMSFVDQQGSGVIKNRFNEGLAAQIAKQQSYGNLNTALDQRLKGVPPGMGQLDKDPLVAQRSLDQMLNFVGGVSAAPKFISSADKANEFVSGITQLKDPLFDPGKRELVSRRLQNLAEEALGYKVDAMSDKGQEAVLKALSMGEQQVPALPSVADNALGMLNKPAAKAPVSDISVNTSKPVDTILKRIENSSSLPGGRGIQGSPITSEEASTLANHFKNVKTSENQRLFGKVVKDWTGDNDVVLGVRKNSYGSTEYIVMGLGNKNPEYKGVIRIHSTSIPDRDIVGDVSADLFKKNVKAKSGQTGINTSKVLEAQQSPVVLDSLVSSNPIISQFPSSL